MEVIEEGLKNIQVKEEIILISLKEGEKWFLARLIKKGGVFCYTCRCVQADAMKKVSISKRAYRLPCEVGIFRRYHF